MCHHELWPTSVIHPFSSLNSVLGFAGGKHYQKIRIPSFRLVLQNFYCSRLLSLHCFLLLFFPYLHPVGLRVQSVALFIPPASTKLKGGYTGFTLSICPSVCPSVCLSVDRIVSALYLEQYSSDPFHICTSYQAISEDVLSVMFKLVCNLDFIFCWLWIQYDSIEWVIMRRRGYPQNAGVLVVLVKYLASL